MPHSRPGLQRSKKTLHGAAVVAGVHLLQPGQGRTSVSMPGPIALGLGLAPAAACCRPGCCAVSSACSCAVALHGLGIERRCWHTAPGTNTGVARAICAQHGAHAAGPGPHYLDECQCSFAPGLEVGRRQPPRGSSRRGLRWPASPLVKGQPSASCSVGPEPRIAAAEAKKPQKRVRRVKFCDP